MKKALLVTALSAAFAVAAPSVVAQPSETAAQEAIVVAQAAPAGSEARPQRATPARSAFKNPGERVEARLAYLKTALKITDAQQSQWDNFANVLRKQARDMGQRFEQRRAQGAKRPDVRNVSAIERLERTQQRMAARSARLNEVVTAAKPLYAALSPEQKQVADEMLAKRGRGGDHRGQRGHRGA